MAALGQARRRFNHVVVSPSGTLAFLNCTDTGAEYGRLVDVTGGQLIGPALLPQRDRHVLAFSPDERLLATAPYNYAPGAPVPEVHLYDTATGRLTLPPLRPPTFVFSLAFSPDSQTLAVGCIGATLLVDPATGKVRSVLRQNTVANQLAFSPDGNTLAVAYRNGWPGDGAGARLWDVTTGQPIGPFQPVSQPDISIPSIAFMDRGRIMLVLDRTDTNRIHCFDAQTGQPWNAVPPSSRMQGRMLVTRSQDAVIAYRAGTATIEQWDLAKGRAVGESMVHPSVVDSIEYSPPGRLVATACGDHSVRIWDSATGLPLGPPLMHAATVQALRFTADEKSLISASATGEMQIMPLAPPFPEDPDRLALWIEAAGGCKLTGVGTSKLDPATWRKRCAELEQRWPDAAAALAKERGADLERFTLALHTHNDHETSQECRCG
jgi:WD40 repeat protein